MSPAVELNELLQRHKFQIVRKRKHLVYENPEGKIFVTPATPSDWRGFRNAISSLKTVIANPPPSSALIEEERQRKQMEASITLPAKSTQPRVGIKGANGAHKKSGGTGIGYVTKVLPALTEAEIEQSRLAKRHSQIIHAANKKVREYRESFVRFGFAEARTQTLQRVQQAATAYYEEQMTAQHGEAIYADFCAHHPAERTAEIEATVETFMTLTWRQNESRIRQQLKQFAAQFDYAIDAQTAPTAQFTLCLPPICTDILKTLTPNNAWVIYVRWLEANFSPEWIAKLVHQKPEAQIETAEVPAEPVAC